MMKPTALDAPESVLDSQERDFVAGVREHGWYSADVAEDEIGPGFRYTTGMWLTLGVPELILFSLPSDISHVIFWDFYRDMQKGQRYEEALPTSDIFGRGQACLMPVDKQHYAEHLGWSHWFYGNDDFPCQQLVWADRNGLFPWDDGVAPAVAANQPDLSGRGWSKLIRRH